MPDKPTTRAKSSERRNVDELFDENFIDRIKSIISEQLAPIKTAVDRNAAILQGIKTDIEGIQNSIKDCSERVETITGVFLPSLVKHVNDTATALAERMLDLDVHSRKWALVIQGIKGPAGEGESVTRDKCLKLAADIGVSDAATTQVSACHRLSHNTSDAGIYLRFSDLAQREAWLTKARNLPRVDPTIHFSPDLPPVLRKMKNDLLKLRRELPADEKRLTRVKHIAHWPYVKLEYKDRRKPAVAPPQTKEQILGDILGFSPKLLFNFNKC